MALILNLELIVSFELFRNPRVSCRGGFILQMDLRAWKETESKSTSFYAANTLSDGGKLNYSSVKKLQYLHTDEYEAEDGSPSKGSGMGSMPSPVPEDDWVEELPRPITVNSAPSNFEAEPEEDYEGEDNFFKN